MSEHLPHHERLEHIPSAEHQEQPQRRPEHTSEHHAEHQAEQLSELSRKAQEAALPAEHTPVNEQGAQQPSAHYANRELKHLTFQRTIVHLQKRLPFADKLLSKAVHQPAIDAVSQVAEKTIARPSGLLGGSICAFVGSAGVLWAAKHYGFLYNYLLFFVLFIAGFGIGIAYELVSKLARRQKS